MTATASHHCLGLEASKIFMSVTLFLGFCFVLLQLYEFHDCGCDFLSRSYYDAAFSVVGLHFSHVVLGLLGLRILLYLGVKRVGVHYMNMGVWY